MLSPLDLIKTYLTFKSYFTWFLMASAIFGIVLFFKRKLVANKPNQHTTTWKGYLTSFLIIIGILGFIYLCFFHKPKEPSSKYTGQLVNEIDKAIDKYDEVINNYQGLKDNWEQELTKVEAELKELYEAQKLTQEQKAKIKELITQTETKINEIKKQKQETENNINILKEQLKQKQAELDNKEKETKTKQEELKTTTNIEDKKRLQEEIYKLQDEKLELVGQIEDIELQIDKLKSKQTMFEGMLSDAMVMKNTLQRSYDKLKTSEKDLFDEIELAEQRRTEIQNNINEINEKQAAIEVRKKGLETIRAGADAARQNLTAWDKKHEFSFGNLRDAIFQGAELYMDAFGGRGMLRAVGGGITKKTAGTIAKGGLIVHEVHRTIHLAQQLMQNEDGTPKMMDQQTYETITKRIEKDLDEAKADYKDSEKKLEEYKQRTSLKNLEKEAKSHANQRREFQTQDRLYLAEYKKIVDELDEKRKEVSLTQKLATNRNELEEKLETKNEEIDARKEELKQKSPNYAKAQERIKQKRYNKFLKPIINK
ncbi:MAG: Chromosome partition protein Smc [Candidatus Phytoplasma pruni]